MNYLKTKKISPIHKKRFGKFLGMSLSNPSMPEQIKNMFWMYYIPTENETYALNDRKEAAFFGLTLMCALDDLDTCYDDAFESRLWLLIKNGSEVDNRRINSLFMSNMTTTSEYIETIGRVLKKEDNLKIVKGININNFISDLIGLGNVYQATKIKYRWASKIYKTEEEV